MSLLYENAISRNQAQDGAEKRKWTEEYYSTILQQSSDLKTDACCTSKRPASYLRPLLSNIHDEVTMKYYGCGIVIPAFLTGASVLDLGCGSGRDVYLISQLVGEQGRAVGVDMTVEQLSVPLAHEEWHRDIFKYQNANTQFLMGKIEDLGSMPALAPGSFDVIVSNCVVNLVPEKRAVLEGAFKLLKEGGELYFSDVYSDVRVPHDLTQNSELWGECLSGALYWNDFLRLAKECGFTDPRLVEDATIGVNNKELQALIDGRVTFYSATYRLFKLKTLEPDCEDYGQAICYKGGIPECEGSFKLDDHHTFPKGKIMTVCGNTYRMLKETRFEAFFDYYGDFSKHFGLYEGCGKSIPYASAQAGGGGGAGSCC